MLVDCRLPFEFGRRANCLAPERLASVSANISPVSGMLADFEDLPGSGQPGIVCLPQGHKSAFVDIGRHVTGVALVTRVPSNGP